MVWSKFKRMDGWTDGRMELNVEKCNVLLGTSFFSSLFGCSSIIRSALPTICADDCWYAAKDVLLEQ